ncbi:uncharacterized protein involved in response to NO [Pseudooceanicola antarcticus]|uniref:Short-chain dehydrogenase n=1 Tax=Pseudooceanicola antarcticus TaxID=1247613 RepID=A0A285J190_9RHOB|nr:NnrS family protein [Pseudooceanicola antarcticus]PJE29862.1 short-chain dehydrogenase [Pseudooceanicola antarcticus]SNY54069.1 uncharacterized protein involved in response to NO [Pseudooceanicola antarcticus]
MTPRDSFGGPALFSYGFRPFFLAAGLFALLVIPLWWLAWRGALSIEGPFSATDWHIHEMIFGYGAAVVAGFLFTAVPNWTGRMPTRGWPLAALLALWGLGRLASSGLLPVGAPLAAGLDQLFLLAVAAMIAREIIAGRNWRNLKVLVPVTLLWASNLTYHLEAMAHGSADLGRRLGLSLLIFLVLLIGGRIIPSFTRNWLVQQGATRLPLAFNRFDGAAILLAALALASWSLAPLHPVTALLGSLAACLHLLRLLRWRGASCWRSPLLLMLHLAYLSVPLGLAATAAAVPGLVGAAVPAHVFGIGAVGGMTLAVMMRASMGHTGRPLSAGTALSSAFLLLCLAMVARLAGARPLPFGIDGITLSALLWSAAFALFLWKVGPWLLRPKLGRKPVSGRAAVPAPRG